MLVFLHLNYILKLKENTPNIGNKRNFASLKKSMKVTRASNTSFEVKKE